MEHDKPIYSAVLLIPGAGKILLKKSWQQKYGMLFKASKFGIGRLEIYDNADFSKQTPYKIVTLQDCIKITPRNSTFFSITTNTAIYDFGTTSSFSLNEWIPALQSVAFPDDCSKITSMEEDNDLYCPSGEGIFNVKLHSSPASVRCRLEAKPYLLVLTNNAVQMRNCHDNKLLYTWPYCFIRRYGYKNGKFTFEAGRKCESGEGVFYLEHSNLQEIFRCFASKIKSMKKMLSNEAFPTLMDMDSSVHTALSMEARSRSPLPLLLSNLTAMYDIEQNISNNSLPKIPDTDDSLLTDLKSIVRPKPTKPPRRNLPVKEMSKPLYEAVNKYDEVEYRSDAWRTMGIDNITHVETKSSETEEKNIFGYGRKVQNMQFQVIQAPKIIADPQNEEDYDRLNFFGSVNKLGNSISTYKQVKVTSNDSSSNQSSFNDYDEIEVETFVKGVNGASKNNEMNNLALKSNLIKMKDNHIAHQFHNDEPYALISKPKQV